jgi:hypothetical protein
MDAEKMTWGSQSSGDSSQRALTLLAGALRVTLYAVLAVLRPFIVAGLSALTLVGLATTLFYGLFVPGSHFPTVVVLLMSVASAVLIVLFYALMEWLLPE